MKNRKKLFEIRLDEWLVAAVVLYMKNRKKLFEIRLDEWLVAAVVLIAICQFMQTCGG